MLRSRSSTPSASPFASEPQKRKKLLRNQPKELFSASGVPRTGLEPVRLTAHAPQTCLSTNFNTRAGVPRRFDGGRGAKIGIRFDIYN